jgi:hypothetical protein
MDYEVLLQLHGELAMAAKNLKKCDAAYRSIRTFRDNRQGLVSCATQLHSAAQALLDHAQQLTAISEHAQLAYYRIAEGLVRPEEVLDIRVDGPRDVQQ